ncbi:MAG: ketopantoate reductase family protein [Candidatus Thorarchaeota archaeon]
MILILGSGSVGSLYGSILYTNGKEVIFIGQSMHIETIKNNGLQIEGLFNLSVEPKHAGTFNYLYNFLEEVSEQIEYILVTTKAHQTRIAAEEILPIVSKKTVFISIQNGIGTEDILKELFPQNVILRAITSVGVNRPEPGKIVFTGEGTILVGATTQNVLEIEIAKEFIRLLSQSGLKSRYTDNIKGAVFTKTIVNCALNPLTALYKVQNIRIKEDEKLAEKARLLAQEAWEVAKALDIQLTVKNPVEYLYEVIDNTAQNTNSMLQDVLNKKKTEIEFLNGKIISLGEKCGVDVSNNKEVYEQIISLEKTFD